MLSTMALKASGTSLVGTIASINHHESSNQDMEEGALLVACGGICGDSFIVRFVAKVVDIP